LLVVVFLVVAFVSSVNADAARKQVVVQNVLGQLESTTVEAYKTILPVPEQQQTQQSKGFSFDKLFDMKQERKVAPRSCFPFKSPEVQNHLQTCCWYDSSTCCTPDVAAVVVPYLMGNLTQLQQEIGLGDQCYFAIADLVCMICSPNTTRFITRSPISSQFQLHLCDSLCDKIFSACIPDLAKIPGMPTTITDGEAFCAELFKDAKQSGSIVFDPKVEESCYDGVPLEQVEEAYCLPGQTKPEKTGLSTGAIAAIVVPVVCGVLVLIVSVAAVVGGYMYWKKKRDAKLITDLTLNTFEEEISHT